MLHIKEVSGFFERKPRFNLVLIKCNQKVEGAELSKELNYEIIDLKNSVIEEKIKMEEIDGYTDLLNTLKDLSNETLKEGVVILNFDLLLSALSKRKRKHFFESVLQKTFPKPIILITFIFKDEVPDEVSHQQFNYAKVIEWESDDEIQVK